MSKKGTKHLTERDFNQIKQLATLGLTTKQIMDVTTRSYSTVRLSVELKDFTAYKEYMARKNAKKTQQPTETAPSLPSSDLHDKSAGPNFPDTIFGLGKDGKIYCWTRQTNNTWSLKT